MRIVPRQREYLNTNFSVEDNARMSGRGMAKRAKGGGGSGAKGSGRTNARDNFAKGLFVQACPASCVL